MAMARRIHITFNSARYTAVSIPDEDCWAIRILAECAVGRKDFGDLNSEQAARLVEIAKILIAKV